MRDSEVYVEIVRSLLFRRPHCVNCEKAVKVIRGLSEEFHTDIMLELNIDGPTPPAPLLDPDCDPCPFEDIGRNR